MGVVAIGLGPLAAAAGELRTVAAVPQSQQLAPATTILTGAAPPSAVLASTGKVASATAPIATAPIAAAPASLTPPDDVQGTFITDAPSASPGVNATPAVAQAPAPPARPTYQAPLAIGAMPPAAAGAYPNGGYPIGPVDMGSAPPGGQPYSYSAAAAQPNAQGPIYDPSQNENGQATAADNGGALDGVDPNQRGFDEGPYPKLGRLWNMFGAGGGLQADTMFGQRFFVRAEALSLWTRGNPVPRS